MTNNPALPGSPAPRNFAAQSFVPLAVHRVIALYVGESGTFTSRCG
jgi:hypothetical protein